MKNNKVKNPCTKRTRSSIGLDSITSNDPSYYNKNTLNYNQATKLQWVSTVGDTIRISSLAQLRGETGVDTTKHLNDFTLASLASIKVVVGPGWAEAGTDPLNVALTQIMADLYSKTTASTIPFDQASLSMYVTTTGSIANLIALAKKAMVSQKFWANRNVYYPRALLKSMGFTYEDLTQNYASYYTQVNDAIRRFNTLECLDFFDVYKRQYALFRNVYVDEDSEMGQIYSFVPYNYYRYKDTENKSVSTLITSFTSFQNLIDTINSMIDDWYGSQDLHYMNGYLLKAYRDNAKFTISELEAGQTLEVVPPDDYIMHQLMNATINRVDDTSLDITGDPVSGAVKWMPKLRDATGEFEFTNGTILRAYNGDPSADDNMEMTRLVNLPAYYTPAGGTAGWYMRYCGPEIVTSVNVYTYDRFTDSITGSSISHNATKATSSMPGVVPVPEAFVTMQAFRYCPFVLIHNDAGNVLGLLGDQYNWTILSYDAWREMQRTALFSLYSVAPVSP